MPKDFFDSLSVEDAGRSFPADFIKPMVDVAVECEGAGDPQPSGFGTSELYYATATACVSFRANGAQFDDAYKNARLALHEAMYSRFLGKIHCAIESAHAGDRNTLLHHLYDMAAMCRGEIK